MPAPGSLARWTLALGIPVISGVALVGAPRPAPVGPYDIRSDSFASSGMVAQGVTVESIWPVSPAEAFGVMTDPESWRERFQLKTNIDLAIGGRFELLFGADRQPPIPEGQQGSETCQILSYVPGEMLSFSWNAPPTFAERAQHTWVVITFTHGPTPGSTAVRLRHVGFGQGGQWPQVEEYFQNAWTRLLGAMGEDLAGAGR